MPKKSDTDSSHDVESPVTVLPDNGMEAAAGVGEGQLASAIQDLAKVIDGEPTTPPVVEAQKPESVQTLPVVEEKPVKKSTGGHGLWLMMAFVSGLGLGMLLGFVLWGQGTQTGEMEEAAVVSENQPTGSVTPTVTPAETEVVRSEVKVQVLNGTGGKGVAATGRDFLQTLGYKNVAVGNAQREDYDMTEILVKAGKQEVFVALKADLGAKYSVASEVGELESESEYDAVVIIGGE